MHLPARPGVLAKQSRRRQRATLQQRGSAHKQAVVVLGCLALRPTSPSACVLQVHSSSPPPLPPPPQGKKSKRTLQVDGVAEGLALVLENHRHHALQGPAAVQQQRGGHPLRLPQPRNLVDLAHCRRGARAGQGRAVTRPPAGRRGAGMPHVAAQPAACVPTPLQGTALAAAAPHLRESAPPRGAAPRRPPAWRPQKRPGRVAPRHRPGQKGHPSGDRRVPAGSWPHPPQS